MWKIIKPWEVIWLAPTFLFGFCNFLNDKKDNIPRITLRNSSLIPKTRFDLSTFLPPTFSTTHAKKTMRKTASENLTPWQDSNCRPSAHEADVMPLR
jgi:hypothetical protein